jgi:hypothetical protein
VNFREDLAQARARRLAQGQKVIARKEFPRPFDPLYPPQMHQKPHPLGKHWKPGRAPVPRGLSITDQQPQKIRKDRKPLDKLRDLECLVFSVGKEDHLFS